MPLIDDVDSKNPGPHALDHWTGVYSNFPIFKSDAKTLLNSIKLHSKM